MRSPQCLICAEARRPWLDADRGDRFRGRDDEVGDVRIYIHMNLASTHMISQGGARTGQASVDAIIARRGIESQRAGQRPPPTIRHGEVRINRSHVGARQERLDTAPFRIGGGKPGVIAEGKGGRITAVVGDCCVQAQRSMFQCVG